MKKAFNLLIAWASNIRIATIFVVYFIMSMLPSICGHILFAYNIFSNSAFAFIYKIIIFIFFVIFVLLKLGGSLHKKYEITVLCCVLLLLILQSFLLILSPSTYPIESIYSHETVTVSISIITKMTLLSRMIVSLFYVFAFMIVFDRKLISLDDAFTVSKVVIIITVFSVAYFLIENIHIYITEKEFFPMTLDSAGSFFDSKNSFGKILFCGSICSLFIFCSKKKYAYLVIPIIFFLVSVFIDCQTSSVAIAIIFVGMLIYCTKHFKLLKKKWFVVALIILIFLTASLFMLFLFVPSFHSSALSNKIYNKIMGLFQNESMNSRFVVWKVFFEKMMAFDKTIFGYGYGIGNNYLLAYTSGASLTMYVHSSFHNGYIQVLSDAGMVGLLCYLFAIAVLLRKTFAISTKKYAFLFASSFISFLLYSLSESIILFSSAYESIMFAFLLITIPSVINNSEQETKSATNFEEDYYLMEI